MCCFLFLKIEKDEPTALSVLQRVHKKESKSMHKNQRYD